MNGRLLHTETCERTQPDSVPPSTQERIQGGGEIGNSNEGAWCQMVPMCQSMSF